MRVLAVGCVISLVACGGGTSSGASSTSTTAAGGSSSGGSTTTTTSSSSSSSGSSSGSSSSGGSGGTEQLTVKNYLSWCSVSVNGGTASSAAVQTVGVSPGTIPLTASPASGNFELGLWHGTSGDTGSGDPGTVSGNTSSTTVVVGNAPTCVWVCCPFTNGTGCPTTDQCP